MKHFDKKMWLGNGFSGRMARRRVRRSLAKKAANAQLRNDVN